ncbi:hypothetical protein [Chitinophaga arvensicola]|uniref:Uncharacterized protein n=1 Tax=Chitinophaga arvensicola TaxID=29529 RepID=A0A1I0SG68_9BACT|nr:hypothetical protein [Chitinophaga arvensicola]SEW57457.1 hypothetical protein SAMN04488122_6793 [Chitinophaga arvensicola]
MENKIQQVPETTSIIESQVHRIEDFLKYLGLPSDGIIASLDQRETMGKNLETLINRVPAEIKKDAKYLSKFVIGAGFGIFDYSMNSIWNEVVLALHKIAITYGLDIFFDKAVGGSSRSLYKDAGDLPMLKEKVLLDTCWKLELITETTHKKLAHILDMRNHIGISHQNDSQINAFELLGYVETCIQEVLLSQPSPDAIHVQAFIQNFKGHDQVIDQPWIENVIPRLQQLPTRHCDSIIRIFFSVYVSTETSTVLQKNISIMAPIIWSLCTDQEKDRLGLILAGYRNNLHVEKHTKGIEFFGFVNGNSYLDIREKEVTLDKLASRLKNAHYSYDNYFHEGSIMEEIMTYIDNAESVPEIVSTHLIEAVILCRIGRGYNYFGGVSPQAKPYYNQFLKIIAPKYTPKIILALTTSEVQRKISNSLSRDACHELLECVNETVVDRRQKEAVEYLLTNMRKNKDAIFNKEFQLISSPFITWIR